METQGSGNESSPPVSRWLAWLAILGLMAGLTAFFHALTDRGDGAVESVMEGDRAMVSLRRDRSGHFLAKGGINGQPMLFLVDTGATDVAISEKTARALGLDFGPRMTVMTAAGPVAAWGTRLDRVNVGALSLENVRATISPGLGKEALLGMSFLQYFNIRQEGDQLLIEAVAK